MEQFLPELLNPNCVAEYFTDKNAVNARVLVCDSPLIPPLGDSIDPLRRKRQAVWHNAKRNALIAKVATGFAARHIESLWDCGLLLDAKKLPQRVPWPTWTVVLVESPEHGRDIQRLLPQWQLIDATAVLPDLDSPGQFGPQPPCPAIITLVAASQLDNFMPDVLIVAMGGDWAFDRSEERRVGKEGRCRW